MYTCASFPDKTQKSKEVSSHEVRISYSQVDEYFNLSEMVALTSGYLQ